MFYKLDTEMSHCPACQSERIRHLDIFIRNREGEPGKFVWFITGCKSCGLVFTNPHPSAEQIETYYAPEGQWVRSKIARPREAEPNPPADDPEAGPVSSMLDDLPVKSGAVLDFGCGTGAVLRKLQRSGWQTYGIDPATAPMLAGEGHTMLDAMPDEPTFELIIMKHVLEHVPNPLAILRQARRCIWNDGHIYVATPSLDRLTEHHAKDYCINTPKHISGFTRRSMRSLLAMAGFRVIADYPASRVQRLALLARADNDVVLVPQPLRDARRELRFFLQQTAGFVEAMKSVRLRAMAANRKAAEREAARAATREARLAARKAEKRRTKKADRPKASAQTRN